MISKFVSDKKDCWEDYIDTSVFAYNTAKHESSQFSPFELMFGRKAVLPADIRSNCEDFNVTQTEFCTGNN